MSTDFLQWNVCSCHLSISNWIAFVCVLVSCWVIKFFILDTNHLSDISISNISSKSLSCLFVLLKRTFFRKKAFKITVVQFINFSFDKSCFCCQEEECFTYSEVLKILSYFFFSNGVIVVYFIYKSLMAFWVTFRIWFEDHLWFIFHLIFFYWMPNCSTTIC